MESEEIKLELGFSPAIYGAGKTLYMRLYHHDLCGQYSTINLCDDESLRMKPIGKWDDIPVYGFLSRTGQA